MSFINSLQNSSSNNNNNSGLPLPQKAKEILVMTVDIGDGKSGKIHVFEEDDAFALALSFVTKYNLPTMIVDVLKDNIE